MNRRPNVLWLMSDQHNAHCAGYAGHPDVRTPNLDRIAANGVEFTQAFANNPICSPSRICFMTGQYVHTHGMIGNNHSEFPDANPDTLACVFRRYGYQTGLFGKSHMVRRWDDDGFEVIRYTDLCDAHHGDPNTTHYFKYLADRGLTNLYEEGTARPGQEYTLDGSAPARLPYEHSIEHYTGEETLRFLDSRDSNRPFFAHMTFQRPHAPIAPAREHFDAYDPAALTLPASAVDWFENRFAGKPRFMIERLGERCGYPLADPDPARLRRCLASYYALITAIDMEIGRVLDRLAAQGELDNTVIVYTADHGDFAGEHGLFHKNLGIYDSIQRIPLLFSWPGGPRGVRCDALVESVDMYPTLCGLCNVPAPDGRDGMDLAPVAIGATPGKDAVFCEWEWRVAGARRISAVRTRDFRLVFYGAGEEGELYDHRSDPGEIHNLWEDVDRRETRRELLEVLLDFTLRYSGRTGTDSDRRLAADRRFSPTDLVHKGRCRWDDLLDACTTVAEWPAADGP